MRAVCYPRVSSAAQRDRHTIDVQLRELPAFVARRGWDLVRPVDHYIDEGRSAKAGKLAKRTGLNALLRDAALGLFDVVVVVDLDRLTRAEDLAERGLILGTLQQAGVRVAEWLSGELLDLDTDHGDLIASIKSYLAAAENRKKSERVRAAKLSIAKRGGKIGGKDPYGLHFDTTTRAWSVNPETAPIAIEVATRVAGGESCYALADELNRRGVPFPGLKGNTNWHRGRVYDLVRSRHLVGEYIAHAATMTIATVPALISEELWQAAQDALARNRKAALRKTKYTYLLEGLAYCGECGGRILVRSGCAIKGGRWHRPAAYICEHRKNLRMGDPARCTAPIYMVAEVDEATWETVCRELEDPELPRELTKERRDRAADAHAWEQDVEGYRAHLARLDKVVESHLERRRRGILTDEDLDRELAKVNRERAAVRTQLRHAERARGRTIGAQGRLREAMASMQAIRAEMETATPEARRGIVLKVINPGGITLSPTSIRIDLLVDRPASTDADDGTLVAGSF